MPAVPLSKTLGDPKPVHRFNLGPGACFFLCSCERSCHLGSGQAVLKVSILGPITDFPVISRPLEIYLLDYQWVKTKLSVNSLLGYLILYILSVASTWLEVVPRKNGIVE